MLLLDCCYSGALDDLRGADVASEMHIVEDAQGFYILTASTGLQAAREEVVVSTGGTVMGRFTSALVTGIETGDADAGRKGRVTLSDLRQHVGKVVTGQRPQFFARRAAGDPVISESPATAGPLLDEDIVADLSASAWHHRLGAVTYLIDVMSSGEGQQREAARAILQQHLPAERDIEVRKRIEDALKAPVNLVVEKPISASASQDATISVLRAEEASVSDHRDVPHPVESTFLRALRAVDRINAESPAVMDAKVADLRAAADPPPNHQPDQINSPTKVALIHAPSGVDRRAIFSVGLAALLIVLVLFFIAVPSKLRPIASSEYIPPAPPAHAVSRPDPPPYARYVALIPSRAKKYSSRSERGLVCG